MFYPVVLKLSGRRVAVIGGGAVAEGKIPALLDAGARVTVVSPALTARLQEIVNSGMAEHRAKSYDESDLTSDVFVVIAATPDPLTQERICRDARRRRILLNTVDDPEQCDFIMPSVVRHGDLIVAVSTSGKSPAFAAWVRRRIEAVVTPEFGRVVTVLGALRAEVKRRFFTIADRKRVFEKVLESGIAEWIRDCDDATAESRARRIIEES